MLEYPDDAGVRPGGRLEIVSVSDGLGGTRQVSLPLEEARPGERLVVVSLFERHRKLLEYPDDAGVRSGVRLEIVSVMPGRAPVRLERAVGRRSG